MVVFNKKKRMKMDIEENKSVGVKLYVCMEYREICGVKDMRRELAFG